MKIPVTEKFYWRMRRLEIKLTRHKGTMTPWAIKLGLFNFITDRLWTTRRYKYIFSQWLLKEYIKDSIEHYHFFEFGNKSNDNFDTFGHLKDNVKK